MRFEDVKPGMDVIFGRESIDFERWGRLNHADYQRVFPDYQNPRQWYERSFQIYENVPLKVLRNDNVPGRNGRPGYMAMQVMTQDGNTGTIFDEFFNPRNENAFRLSVVQEGRDVRNTRLMAARMGLPEGPEGIVSSYVSGIDKKNSGQQQDMLIQQQGISYVAPKRTRQSGGKSRRGRKNRRRTRKH